MLKIGLDIDNTLADFDGAYIKRFKRWPNKDWAITRNVEHILIKEKDFWLNLRVIRRPDFAPKLYCSARVNSKRWTKQYLEEQDFPKAPLYQIPGYKLSKAKVLRGRVDVFIEDSLKNFIDLNSNGIPCLLIDSPKNRDWGPIGRIYNLDYYHIEDTYDLFMSTIFQNFKGLL